MEKKVKKEDIRKRAKEIWEKKCQAMQTELDDWLQAERELRAELGDKKPEEYTPEEKEKISVRAQTMREVKVNALHTAFDDWIQAEQELYGELKSGVSLQDLFGRWFDAVQPHVSSLLKSDPETTSGEVYDIMGKQYVELMSDVLN